MTEKINGQGFRPVEPTSARRVEASKSSPAAPEKSEREGAGDTVELTRSGLLLGKLEEAVRGASGVDSERVQAVRDALSSGTYEVDPQAVADKMIRLERELAR